MESTEKTCEYMCPKLEPHKEVDSPAEQTHEAEQQEERKEPSLEQEPVSSVIATLKKRKMIATPSTRTSVLVKALQSLFHFFIHVESMGDMFNLRDAIRHAFMRQHAEQGLELNIEQADALARGKLQAIRLSLSTNDHQRFGKAIAATVNYEALSDVLMKEFKWFRELQATIVGHVLLPSPELHDALIQYLTSVRAYIESGVVQKILVVSINIAESIVSRVNLKKPTGSVSQKKCIHMSTTTNNPCKKSIKIDTGNQFCQYHKAQSEILMNKSQRFHELQNNMAAQFSLPEVEQASECTREKEREHLLRLGCDDADISDIMPNYAHQLPRQFLLCEVATSGLSPQEAVTVAKIKFQNSIEIACEHPNCRLNITCFKFTIARHQDKQYTIECINHGPVAGNIYWRHQPSTFRCAVWQSWIGKNVQGVCHVCNDPLYCVLHVLDMWELCHDMARANGGPYSLHNMLPGSRRCNNAQRTLRIAEYQRYIGNVSLTDHVCHVSSGEFAAMFQNATQELLQQFCKSP